MKKSTSIFFLIILIVIACRKPKLYDEAKYNEWFQGGTNTVFDQTGSAYGHPFPSLLGRNLSAHELGDKSQAATFVTTPAPINPGLGPLYNNVSCASCHVNDGRGRPPLPGENLNSMLFRISVPGTDEHNGMLGVPGFGIQIQTRAIYGKQPEANVAIHYTEEIGYYEDGSTYSLRRPIYSVINSYIPFPSNALVSARIARPFVGLGLLQAIPESIILAREDINDMDRDGISGKANYVWNYETQQKELGRFGWKASQPNLKQQAALAFNEDIGITNPIFKTENSFGQAQFDNLNDEVEINDSILTTVGFYTQSLAVPARRDINDPTVQKGKQLFNFLYCSGCHMAVAHTADNMAFPDVSGQVIFPYSDMLLHDMGPDLADSRSEYEASGNEWRTPPLWGIGLSQRVNGNTYFLNDGRARSLEEAILWHGGEALRMREGFKKLSKPDRDALIRFLNSL